MPDRLDRALTAMPDDIRQAAAAPPPPPPSPPTLLHILLTQPYLSFTTWLTRTKNFSGPRALRRARIDRALRRARIGVAIGMLCSVFISAILIASPELSLVPIVLIGLSFGILVHAAVKVDRVGVWVGSGLVLAALPAFNAWVTVLCTYPERYLEVVGIAYRGWCVWGSGVCLYFASALTGDDTTLINYSFLVLTWTFICARVPRDWFFDEDKYKRDFVGLFGVQICTLLSMAILYAQGKRLITVTV